MHILMYNAVSNSDGIIGIDDGVFYKKIDWHWIKNIYIEMIV